MPELSEKYGFMRLDLRCGLNKDYLAEGQLDDTSISQINFVGEDKVNMELHFGCAMVTLGGEGQGTKL